MLNPYGYLFAAGQSDDCDQVAGHADHHVDHARDRGKLQQSRRIAIE